MPSLNPSLLLAAARAFIGIGEDGPNNRGQVVEHFLREVGRPPGDPWCAAFVWHVGYWSHYDPATLTSSWPLPRTASCTVLGQFAGARAVLFTEPLPGDVFLRFSPERHRFTHTGVVVAVAERKVSMTSEAGSVSVVANAAILCTTIEGNTNDDGSHDGRRTLLRSRQLDTVAGDRFIRWTALSPAAR